MSYPASAARNTQSPLAEKGLLISPPEQTFRLVTHKDIPEHAIEQFADAVASYMRVH